MTLSIRRSPSLTPRSAFAGFRFPAEVIVVAVRWYLRYSLSYRDVEELLVERGVEVDQVSDRGRRFPASPSSEPCWPLVAAHGSSSPHGRAGICFLLVRAVLCAAYVAAGAVGVYEA